MQVNVEVPKVDPKVDQEGDTVEVALGEKYSRCHFPRIVIETLAAERWRPVLP